MKTFTPFLWAAVLLLAGCHDDSARVSLGWFTTKDVVVNGFTDPKIPGVTCHVAHVEDDLSFSDPSDMSIACRQTGPITNDMIKHIDKSKSGETVFKESLSVLFKSLKVRRIWDGQHQTLIYLSYSTKQTKGSTHHAISTVPLYGTKAWQQSQ
ncbi:CreA family protein [Gallaecimonas mangrovi]|uniref:CreA family protein n=1 Tax=Gallaecimonas mangrovi TaxID=2291597 RepID=UPI000E1FFE77|nr:CreA family protein [Gallaecimonas mangrovi]